MPETHKSSSTLMFLRGEDLAEHSDELQRFFLSLTDEKITFALSIDQLARAHTLLVSLDKDGRWRGVAGWRKRWVFGIFFLVVHRDFQRRGLGKDLTKGILEGISPWQVLLLSVTRSNARARKLYEQLGFETLKRGRQHVIKAYRNPALSLWRWPLRLALLMKS